MASVNIWHWILLLLLAVAVAWPVLKRLAGRLGSRRETDLEVLNRLAPRPPPGPPDRPFFAYHAPTAQRAAEPPPASEPGPGLPLWTKIALTVLYIPGAVALHMFWQLARPAVHRAIASIDIGNPKVVAFVSALVISAAWVTVFLLPLYLIWRRPRGVVR